MSVPTKVLIVDDEPHIRRAVRHAVADDFDRALEAGTASEADLALPDKPGSASVEILLRRGAGGRQYEV